MVTALPMEAVAEATANALTPASLACRPLWITCKRCRGQIKPNCDAGHYYLLNNYNPGYNADGTLAVNDSNAYAPFTIPPTSVRHIGDALLENNISFKYYGDGWDFICQILTTPIRSTPTATSATRSSTRAIS